MSGGIPKRTTGNGRRLRALRFFFVGFGSLIVIRLFMLQVVSSGFYTAFAEDQYSLYEVLVPERGTMFAKDAGDDTEYAVATTEPRAFVYVDPRKLVDREAEALAMARALGMDGIPAYERQALLDELAAAGKNDEVAALLALDAPTPCAEAVPCVVADVAPTPVELLVSRIMNAAPDDSWEPVMRNVAPEALDRLLDQDIAGIGYLMEAARAYPERGFGGHVLGFVGRDPDGNPVGQYGLEGYFDDFLAGVPGSLYSQADRTGSWIGVGERSFTPAIDGGDLLLTIDRTVQYTACHLLAVGVERFDADGGALVIVDPTTGGVIAMCGAPDFDPSGYAAVDDISSYNNPAIYEP